MGALIRTANQFQNSDFPTPRGYEKAVYPPFNLKGNVRAGSADGGGGDVTDGASRRRGAWHVEPFNQTTAQLTRWNVHKYGRNMLLP
jgi:hypothetical protein